MPQKETTYRYMTRQQLAAAAGVSTNTIRRYIKAVWPELEKLGCTSYSLLTPAAVKYICEHYGIDL